MIKEIFIDEPDHLLRIIKRIMYAEGDSIGLKTECAKLLKEKLRKIVEIFKQEDCKQQLDFNVLSHIFKREIVRFYRTKKLTKGILPKNDEESDKSNEEFFGSESESEFETMQDLVVKKADSFEQLEISSQ